VNGRPPQELSVVSLETRRSRVWNANLVALLGGYTYIVDRGVVLPEGKWYSPTMARTSFLTLDPKGRTTLPEEVRTALGVEPGDFILLERTERGTFELVPATLVPNDQLWFHHPDIQARVAQAERDFAEGRSTRTRTPEEAQALLDSLKQHPGR
jgi:bifunctional DNA-binding transcriptional regulator/antitoxin component of YhaV-PrlF toxin-antitoxin module